MQNSFLITVEKSIKLSVKAKKKSAKKKVKTTYLENFQNYAIEVINQKISDVKRSLTSIRLQFLYSKFDD